MDIQQSLYVRKEGILGLDYWSVRAYDCHVVCGVDLNEFLWEFDKSGGKDDFHTRPRYLHEFMSTMELIDLGFSGPNFT